MGMYDNIKCDYLLPNPDHNAVKFQTKSIGDPSMTDYRIESDGALMVRKVEYDWVEDDSPWGGGLEERSFEWVPCPYTGGVEFYQYIPKDNSIDVAPFKRRENGSAWIQYVALFDEGKLLLLRPQKPEFEVMD